MRARQSAVSLDVHWPVRAAHRTGGRRQPEGSGLRQRVYSHGATSMAGGSARRWSVGSGRRRPVDARQVFDGLLPSRASSRGDKRDRTKLMACLVRLKD
jgi:hypothetical protein